MTSARNSSMTENQTTPEEIPNRVWRSLRSFFWTATFYCVFAVASTLFSLFLFLPLWILVSLFPRAVVIPIGIARTTFRFFLWLFSAVGAYKLESPLGFDQLATSQAGVYVANHGSLLDVLFLLVLVPNSSCLLKGSSKGNRAVMPLLWRAFIVGPYSLAGFVAMPDLEDLEAMLATFQRCEKLLASGRSLIIFPEGTRSPDCRLLPFLDFPFKLAKRANVPVVPVAIHTDRPILAKGNNTVSGLGPTIFQIHALSPIFPQKRDRANDLSVHSRRLIRRELEAIAKSGTRQYHC